MNPPRRRRAPHLQSGRPAGRMSRWFPELGATDEDDVDSDQVGAPDPYSDDRPIDPYSGPVYRGPTGRQ